MSPLGLLPKAGRFWSGFFGSRLYGISNAVLPCSIWLLCKQSGLRAQHRRIPAGRLLTQFLVGEFLLLWNVIPPAIPSVFVLASGLRFGSEIIMTTVLLISTSVTFWMVPDELFHVYAFLPSPSLCWGTGWFLCLGSSQFFGCHLSPLNPRFLVRSDS